MATNSHPVKPVDIDDLRRLRRFLVLGTETDAYKPAPTTAPSLTKDLAPTITKLISLDQGDTVVREIIRFHEEHISAHEDAVIFALAMCARDPDLKTKSAAYDRAFSKICRTPLQLFTFVNYCAYFSKSRAGQGGDGQGQGWGQAQRKAMASFYNGMPAKELCLMLCRYTRRHKWTHRDILKLAHVRPANEGEYFCSRGVDPGGSDTGGSVSSLFDE